MLSEHDKLILLPFARLVDGNVFAGSRVGSAACMQDVEDLAHSYGHTKVSCPLLGSLACYLKSCEWIWQDIDDNWSDHIYLLALATKIKLLISLSDQTEIGQLVNSGLDSSDLDEYNNHELDIARHEVHLFNASAKLAKHLKT